MQGTSKSRKNSDTRPLPTGWREHYDTERGVWYYIDLGVMPPCVTFQHPADKTGGGASSSAGSSTGAGTAGRAPGIRPLALTPRDKGKAKEGSSHRRRPSYGSSFLDFSEPAAPSNASSVPQIPPIVSVMSDPPSAKGSKKEGGGPSNSKPKDSEEESRLDLTGDDDDDFKTYAQKLYATSIRSISRNSAATVPYDMGRRESTTSNNTSRSQQGDFASPNTGTSGVTSPPTSSTPLSSSSMSPSQHSLLSPPLAPSLPTQRHSMPTESSTGQPTRPLAKTRQTRNMTFSGMTLASLHGVTSPLAKGDLTTLYHSSVITSPPPSGTPPPSQTQPSVSGNRALPIGPRSRNQRTSSNGSFLSIPPEEDENSSSASMMMTSSSTTSDSQRPSSRAIKPLPIAPLSLKPGKTTHANNSSIASSSSSIHPVSTSSGHTATTRGHIRQKSATTLPPSTSGITEDDILILPPPQPRFHGRGVSSSSRSVLYAAEPQQDDDKFSIRSVPLPNRHHQKSNTASSSPLTSWEVKPHPYSTTRNSDQVVILQPKPVRPLKGVNLTLHEQAAAVSLDTTNGNAATNASANTLSDGTNQSAKGSAGKNSFFHKFGVVIGGRL